MTIPTLGRANILRAATLATATAITIAGDAVLAADHELVSAVVVSRHGVRSPTDTRPPLASIAADPWPAWPVAPGYLTPRGGELAQRLGAFYREYYTAEGLLPAQGCPAPGVVFTWADVDQRTRVTAQSLLDGMFPNCNLEPRYRIGAHVDALFHPTRAGVCRIDPAHARAAVVQRAGGSLAGLQANFRAEIAELQSVLKCCSPALCRGPGATGSCVLENLATEIVETGDSVRLAGPIAIGSTASEVFLLEYAQGLPSHQVAWGRASTPLAMRPLLKLHTLQFALMQRTPYLAVRQGSALVDTIVSTLQRAIDGETNPKLTLLIGHDTNLSNIGGMLGLRWSLPSYLPDQTPPAGALHFELLRERGTAAHAVRIRYVAQTLDQMREVATLDRANPPEQATVAIDGCASGEACAWSTFATLARSSLDRACIAPPAR